MEPNPTQTLNPIQRLKSLVPLHLAFALGLALVLGTAALVYWPGIEGPMVLDDFHNLDRLGTAGGIDDLESARQFVFGNNSGPLGRPVSMLAFLIDGQDWPIDIAKFKYTNILIHLLCGLAFCWLSYQLCQVLRLSQSDSATLSLIVTAIWLLHPLNVSTSLYIIQRMAQLMTLFASFAVLFYLKGRMLLAKDPRRAHFLLCLSLFPFGLLSVFSKENGVLLLLLIVLLENLFFHKQVQTTFFKFWYRGAVLSSLAIVLVVLAWNLPDHLEVYSYRSFSLKERLLTEARVVADYLWRILLPDDRVGSIFHDDYVKSSSLLRPFGTLVAILFIGSLIGSGFYFARTHAVYSFAVLWFFGLHLMESTYMPLELYFEHRNYMAMYGPLFALCWYSRLLLVSKADKVLKSIVALTASALVILGISLTVQSVNVWKNETSYYQHVADQHPTSMRAQMVYSIHLEQQGQLQESLERLYIAREYSPNETIILLHLWNFACRYDLEQPQSLVEIASIPSLQYRGDNINFQLNLVLQNLLEGNCEPPELESMVSLFDRIEEFPMGVSRRTLFYQNYSAVFGLYGERDRLLETLERSFDANPIVATALQQLTFAINFDNLDLGRKYLQQARDIDSNRSWLQASHRESIDAMVRVAEEHFNTSME